MTLDGDGTEIRVGQYVSWKDGIERSGKVHSVHNGWVGVETEDPITGEPYTAVVSARRCWRE
jgi:hypothetical protein